MKSETLQDVAKLLYTVSQAAQALSLSRSVCYRLVLTGELLSVKIGGLRRIPLTGLHQYVGRLIAQSEQEAA